MIVVADAVTIYSVYNSDVMYKRGKTKHLYKYLHKKKHKKTHMSALKNNVKKRKISSYLKIPPVIRFKCGRSNERKLWKHNRDTCINITSLGLHLFSRSFPFFRQLPNDDKTFKLKLKMVSNRAKQPSHDTHSH